MLERLEHQHRGALAEHDAAARGVVRARPFASAALAGERARAMVHVDDHRAQLVAAAGEDHVRAAAAQEVAS